MTQTAQPVRVQLTRRKGFDLQSVSKALNGLPAVNCARPGKWGNPFPIGREGPLGRIAPDNEGAVGFFRAMLSDPELRSAAGYPTDLSPLRGKNLACFCGPKEFCHCDVLLEVANA